MNRHKGSTSSPGSPHRSAPRPPRPRVGARFAKRLRPVFPRVDSVFMIRALGNVRGPVGAPVRLPVFPRISILMI